VKNPIGKNIKKYREIQGLTQKQLADKLGTKNSRISNWEQGANNPPADIIGELCTILNVSASELLGLKLTTNELSTDEQKILEAYKTKTHMQHAVKVLLGIDNP
jgi:transcriptional regulator with XRE-family HTH domain